MDPAQILVVDDDANMLLLMQHNLQSHGHRVSTADDGADGLRLALEGHFDLFLLDVMLPNISGFELCREIRREERYSDTPILMVTAQSQMTNFDAASELGATSYVTKPFDPIGLMDLVRDHLASSSEPR